MSVPDELVEVAARALYDLREEGGMRPVVSRWPPSDPDESDDYRFEARAVLAGAFDAGWAFTPRGSSSLPVHSNETVDVLGLAKERARERDEAQAQADALAEALDFLIGTGYGDVAQGMAIETLRAFRESGERA